MRPHVHSTATESELRELLRDAARGQLITDNGISDEIDTILERVAASGRITAVDRGAFALRQALEDADHRERDDTADAD